MPSLSDASAAFCKAFNCTLPLVCPPMAGVAGGELSAEVFKAGGLGFVGAVRTGSRTFPMFALIDSILQGHRELENLKEEVGKAKNSLRLNDDDELPYVFSALPPFPNRSLTMLLPALPLLTPSVSYSVGIGLVLWCLEPPFRTTSPSDITSVQDSFLRYILFGARARFIWLSFSHGKLEEWVKRVRKMEEEGPKGEGEQARKEKIKVFVMVQSEEMGKEVREWEVDAVVAQGAFFFPSFLCFFPPLMSLTNLPLVGTEAGGHGPTYEVGLPLHDLITRLSPLYPSASPPFLLAAGGIASPSTVTAALSSGAAAVVCGTALSAAAESLLPQPQKENLLRVDSGDKTTKSLNWDIARDGKNYWPGGVDGRAVKNLTSEEELGDPAKAKERYAVAVKEKDLNRIATWAGASFFLSATSSA
jgi:nitronate monooxygenase